MRPFCSMTSCRFQWREPLLAGRDVALVHLLMDSGANPKIADTIAGKSAADYAADDPRGAAIAKILADAKPVAKKAIAGPVR